MPKKKAEKEVEKPQTLKGKGKGKASPPKKKQEVEEEEVEEEDQGTDNLEKYRVPGERMTEVSPADLKAWPKTKNCKFYVSVDNKVVEYELENGESDKV